MSKFKKGDLVFGVNRVAEIPSDGGIIRRVIGDKYYYLDHIGGGGLGNRGEEELRRARK